MRSREHLTYANVMSTIAVFGVLAGGGAYAASKIDTPDIANKAITAKKLDNRAVKGGKLAAGSVKSGKLADGAVTPSKLSEGIGASVAVAGVTVGADGTIEAWFNRVGGEPHVFHQRTGHYQLEIPGTDVSSAGAFGMDVNGAGVQSATLEGEQGGDISVVRQYSSTLPATPLVVTRDSTGTPVDRAFSYVLFGGEYVPEP